ncbi:MAG: sortase A [Glaciecola sp.]|jgi:sortase A
MSVSQRAARGVGWTLILLGIHILLYLTYLLWWTGMETGAVQAELLEEFALDFGDPQAALPGEYQDITDAEVAAVAAGDAYAAMWFERDGQRVVHDDVLYVVEGVDVDSLKRGPGHEPRSDKPGGAGNFVISGHRTTYGQPFYNLDVLEPGDEIHVVDRDGKKWVYDYQESLIVQPTDVWVTRRGAFGDEPTLTLTTCNPRWSASQRLIAWATLRVDEPTDQASEAAP